MLPLCYHVVDDQDRGIPGVHILINVYEAGFSERKKFQALTDWLGYASLWYSLPVLTMDDPRPITPTAGECVCTIFVLRIAPSLEAPWKYINITFPIDSNVGTVKLILDKQPRLEVPDGFDSALMSFKRDLPAGDIWDMDPNSPSVVTLYNTEQATKGDSVLQ